MIEIKFDVTNQQEAIKVRSIIDNMYGAGASSAPISAPSAPAPVAPVQAPTPVAPAAPTLPTQAPVAPAPMAPTAPASTATAPVATVTTPQQGQPAVDLSDAGLQMLVQRVAQSGVAVPSILQELQACGATKVSELQPQMRQMFRDKLVALTGGAIQ